MHVALLGNFPDDLDHPRGGVEAVAVSLARGLIRAGEELTLLRYPAPVAGETLHPELGCRVVGFPSVRPAGLTFSTLTPRAVARELARLAPDIVHVQGLPELLPAAKASASKPSSANVPAVLTIHGIPHEDARYRTGAFSDFAARWRERSFRHALPRYRRTIAISPYVLAEMGRAADRSCRSIPNPVDERFFEVPRAPEPKTVLCVGVLGRRKNAAQLVEAAARLRESIGGVRYRMAGPWDSDYRSTVMTAIKAHGLEQEFEFLGSIDRDQLLAELARCSLLVLPSLQETAPMAIQEAMAARVPVAAAAVGGIPELLGDGEAGLLFDPRDPNEVAQALSTLLQDDVLRSRLSSSARERAEAFRVEAVVSATLEVYREAISDA